MICPPQTSLRALGDYHLKDLARPEPIFQCVSADLPADFPPLRMDSPRPSAGVPAPQLLATKLYMPRARPDLVARPRLFARLDAGLHGAADPGLRASRVRQDHAAGRLAAPDGAPGGLAGARCGR